jgi:hypothetical protein
MAQQGLDIDDIGRCLPIRVAELVRGDGLGESLSIDLKISESKGQEYAIGP